MAKYLPEGLGGHISAREFQATKAKALLIRQPVIDAIDQLRKAHENAFAKSLSPAPPVLIGEKGSGKSAALAQIVYWARRSGWLVLYMPNGMDITAGGDFIEKSPLRKDEAIWDDPSTSYKLLNTFLTAHAEKLKELPVKTKCVFRNRFSTHSAIIYCLLLVDHLDSLWVSFMPRLFSTWLNTVLPCPSSLPPPIII